MASNIFDLPLPFNPVIAENVLSNGEIFVHYAYDLNPSKIISSKYIKVGMEKFVYLWDKLNIKI